MFTRTKILILTAFILGLTIMWNVKTKHNKGMVIILNGPSAAGKSSIQKAFQQLMLPNLWIKVGIDTLFDGPMPDINPENMHYWQAPNPIRWVETSKDSQQNNIIKLLVGEQGEQVAYGMNSAIAAYANQGCNVIVDYIAYKQAWIEDLQSKLKSIETRWIKVNLPLKVIEEREAARGSSPAGHARSHYDTVHWDIKYDLEVDSEKNSPTEIAALIKNLIRT